MEALPDNLENMDSVALSALLRTRHEDHLSKAHAALTASSERDMLRSEVNILKENVRQLKEEPDSDPGPAHAAPPESNVEELSLSMGFLAFGLVAMLFQFIVMIKTDGAWNLQTARLFGLILIITAGGFLTSAGYRPDQITPMIGLLGTVAGFLLGQQTLKPTQDKSPPSSDAPQAG